MVFNSIKEVKQAEADSLKEQTSKFCPIIKNNCRKDCTCFVKPKISKKDSTDQWTFYKALCVHPVHDGIYVVEHAGIVNINAY